MTAATFNPVGRHAVAGLCEAGYRTGVLYAAMCVTTFLGCAGSDTGLQLVEVSGIVTYDDKPLEGANVVFHPNDDSAKSLASQAVTNGEGRFQLTTHVGQGKFKPGIAPGRYTVPITKLNTAAIASTLSPPRDMLAKKYADPKTSGLTANVVAGEKNEFKFPLKGADSGGPGAPDEP